MKACENRFTHAITDNCLTLNDYAYVTLIRNNETRNIKTTAPQISLFITSPTFDVRYPSDNIRLVACIMQPCDSTKKKTC